MKIDLSLDTSSVLCTREQCACDAMFTNPIMKVHGHRDISLEFYSLIKLFQTTITRKNTSVVSTERPSVVMVPSFTCQMLPDLRQSNIPSYVIVMPKDGVLLQTAGSH